MIYFVKIMNILHIMQGAKGIYIYEYNCVCVCVCISYFFTPLLNVFDTSVKLLIKQQF